MAKDGWFDGLWKWIVSVFEAQQYPQDEVLPFDSTLKILPTQENLSLT
jgi:hypothetical protein